MILTFHISSHGRIKVGFRWGRPNIVKVVCVLFTSPGAVSSDGFRFGPSFFFFFSWQVLVYSAASFLQWHISRNCSGNRLEGAQVHWLFTKKFRAHSLGKSTNDSFKLESLFKVGTIWKWYVLILQSKSNQAANEINQNWPHNSITCAWLINSFAANLWKKDLFFFFF